MGPIAYLALVVLVTLSGLLGMLSAIRRIPPGHRGVQFRLGRLVKELPAGTAWVLPLVDSVMLVDLAEQTIPLPADLRLAGGSQDYKVEGSFTCKIVKPVPAVVAAMQARQELAVVVGGTLLAELKRVGPAAILDRPAQAQRSALDVLNEQMAPAWQVKFTGVEFKLLPA
jgi:regulator of protease activity HflC (stomatin/prohibitin superfamily)